MAAMLHQYDNNLASICSEGTHTVDHNLFGGDWKLDPTRCHQRRRMPLLYSFPAIRGMCLTKNPFATLVCDCRTDIMPLL